MVQIAPLGAKVRAAPRRPLAGSVLEYVLRRIGRLVVSFIILATVAFLVLRLVPGDPIRESLGPTVPEAIVQARRVQVGLDLPLWEQYLQFWARLLRGDLGDSFSLFQPVTNLIGQRLVATLELAGLAVLLTLVCAVPIGLAIAALTRGGRRRGLELGYSAAAGFFAVVPEFIVGVFLVYFFAVQTQLLPVAGRAGPATYILPVLALSIGGIAALSRIVRVEALTVLSQDYMRTARSKRMGRARLYFLHALPNLLTSALTIGGLLFGALIAGTVLVENIFAWPGLGQTIIQSIREKDYPLAQGVIIIYGTIVLLVTLLVDLLLMAIDRRSTVRDH